MTGCDIIACENKMPKRGGRRCHLHMYEAEHPDVVTVEQWLAMPKRSHARCGGTFQALSRRVEGRLVVECDGCGVRGFPTFENVEAEACVSA